jgi:guanylate kinase
MSELLRQLKENVPLYRANDRVREKLIREHRKLVALAGPVGAGKTEIATRVTEIDPAIQPLNTTTTRARKKSDPKAFQTADEGVTIDGLTEMIWRGELANYDVIEATGAIYATTPEGFSSEYSIGPITATNIDVLQSLQLEQFNPVYIVSPVGMWRSFLNKSLNDRADLIKNRMPEAIESLEYAQQHMQQFDFIDNSDRIDVAATAVIAIARGLPSATMPKDAAALRINEMLAFAKEQAL